MINSQELAIAIKQEAKTRKIPVGKMLAACDLSVNTLSSMQSGGYFPRLEAIIKIADFLDCSIDYLLNRKGVSEPLQDNLQEEERKLLTNFRLLNGEGQFKLSDYADDLVLSRKYIKVKQEKTVSAG